MPCLIGLVALAIPRVVIAGLYFLSTWFNGIFENVIVLLLGFVFMPMTTLWYSVVINYFGGEWSLIPIIGGVMAVMSDLGQLGVRNKK